MSLKQMHEASKQERLSTDMNINWAQQQAQQRQAIAELMSENKSLRNETEKAAADAEKYKSSYQRIRDLYDGTKAYAEQLAEKNRTLESELFRQTNAADDRWRKYKRLAMLGIAYGIVVTICQGFASDCVQSDFKAILKLAWVFLQGFTGTAFKAALRASEAAFGWARVPVMYGLPLLIFAAFALAILRLGELLLDWYSIYADLISAAVWMISAAVLVILADTIRSVIPINLFLLLIIIHAAYLIVRKITETGG